MLPKKYTASEPIPPQRHALHRGSRSSGLKADRWRSRDHTRSPWDAYLPAPKNLTPLPRQQPLTCHTQTVRAGAIGFIRINDIGNSGWGIRYTFVGSAFLAGNTTTRGRPDTGRDGLASFQNCQHDRFVGVVITDGGSGPVRVTGAVPCTRYCR